MREPLVVTIPHQLGRVEAKRRIDGNLAMIRSQVTGFGASLEDRWEQDDLHFKVGFLAQTVTGRIQFLDDVVRVEVDLPWMLKMLAERVRTRIESRGRSLLTKKT